VLGKAERITVAPLAASGQDTDVLTVAVEAGGTLDLELTALVPAAAKPGSAIVLQLAQYEARQQRALGGIGVVVRVT
jgi:hypothetical protein